MEKLTLVNCHTHHAKEGDIAIQNIHQREQHLAMEQFRYCSVGLHPRFLEPDKIATDDAWLKSSLAKPNVLAVGEAGLDGLIDLPLEIQMTIFRQQVLLSETFEKPMILHCVRAHHQLLQIKKEMRPQQPWVIHGFNKHPQLAQTLVNAGFILSFGASIFNKNSHAASALSGLPEDTFFLENDDKMLDISSLYEKAAAIRGISVPELACKLMVLFERVFLKKCWIESDCTAYSFKKPETL